MRPAVRSVLLAGLATAVAVGVGVAVTRDDDAPTSAPDEPVAPSSIPLEEFDTSEVAVARSAFCGRIPPESVEETLGAPVGSSRSWENGDRVRLEPVAGTAGEDAEAVEDVAHEYGCRYQADARRRVVATGWVFAPPVTKKTARDLAEAATSTEGCEPVDDAPDYGSPSAALLCGDTTDAASDVTASFRGLFGDAWLTCEVEQGRLARDGADVRDAVDDLVERAGQWCVTVARSASL